MILLNPTNVSNLTQQRPGCLGIAIYGTTDKQSRILVHKKISAPRALDLTHTNTLFLQIRPPNNGTTLSSMEFTQSWARLSYDWHCLADQRPLSNVFQLFFWSSRWTIVMLWQTRKSFVSCYICVYVELMEGRGTARALLFLQWQMHNSWIHRRYTRRGSCDVSKVIHLKVTLSSGIKRKD